MDAQTYLLAYKADEAIRSIETERRRQNLEHLARDARQRETSRKARSTGASAHRGH